jgi:hypothetical protein
VSNTLALYSEEFISLKQYYNILKIYLPKIIQIAVSLLIIGCFNLESIENENIHNIKNINEKKVRKIEIFSIMLQYKDQQKKLIKSLSGRNEIENFIKSLKSLERVHQNHPQYPNRWKVLIEIEGMEDEELKIFQMRGDHKNLYVRCLGHRWIGSAATAISSDVHRWMANNIGLPNVE